jgi:hypothetical protein
LICFGFMLPPLIVGRFGSTIREIRDTAYLNDMASRSKDKGLHCKRCGCRVVQGGTADGFCGDL